MKTTDYCSYELSKALKAAGFDEPCDHYYDIEDAPDGCYWEGDSLHKKNHNEDIPKFSAPTLWQAQKWLREKKQLAIIVGMTRFDDWFYGIYDKCGKCLKDDGTQRYSYEQALSAGISAALELINENNKEK